MRRLKRNHYITYPIQCRCKTVAKHSRIIVCTVIANSLNLMTPLKNVPFVEEKKRLLLCQFSNIHFQAVWQIGFLRAADIKPGKNPSDAKCTVAQHLSNEKRMWCIVLIHFPPSLGLLQVFVAPPRLLLSANGVAETSSCAGRQTKTVRF